MSITPGSRAEAQVWETAIEVAQLFQNIPWVIVGAQMIMLLEREAGRDSGRATLDLDAIVDVRAMANGTEEAARRLVDAGFEPDGAHGYRFRRGSNQVDLLAPDNLGPRANLTLIPPHTTTAIPGGTRALRTTRSLEVNVQTVGSGTLPVPSLAGAIAIKLRAWESRRLARDLDDLVRLLTLVDDAEGVRDELARRERRALGQVDRLKDYANPVWRAAPDRDEAYAAFVRLSD